jgi:hypothetical protein
MAASLEPSPPQWLRSLRDLAQEWMSANTLGKLQAPTGAYSDLMFSFGLARLGAGEAARELMAGARSVLPSQDAAHHFLLDAYCYRVSQALERHEHSGPLPQDLLGRLPRMGEFEAYVVNRLRKHSRILEPDQRIDPYLKWSARVSHLNGELARLRETTEGGPFANGVRTLLAARAQRHDVATRHWEILGLALEFASRVGEEFAREILEQALPAYDALPTPVNYSILEERASFLAKGFSTAARFQLIEYIRLLLMRSESLLQLAPSAAALKSMEITEFLLDRRRREPQRAAGDGAVKALERLAYEGFSAARIAGLPEEIERLIALLTNLILEGRELSAVDPMRLPVLLQVAAAWYVLGREDQAEGVLHAAHTMLRHDDLTSSDTVHLACAYAAALRLAPVAIARGRLEEIFTAVKEVDDTYKTRPYYSRFQLEVIEAVVLAGVAISLR